MASNSDLTRSVETGAYKNESNERLRELIAGSMDIGGSNPIALHRITHAADILKKELEVRDAELRERMAEDRNRKIEARLDALKKPHWSVTPTFWIALAGVFIGLCAWLFPRAPDALKEESKSAVVPILSAPTQTPPHSAAPAPAVAPQNPKADSVSTPSKPPAP